MLTQEKKMNLTLIMYYVSCQLQIIGIIITMSHIIIVHYVIPRLEMYNRGMSRLLLFFFFHCPIEFLLLNTTCTISKVYDDALCTCHVCAYGENNVT